jgi:uncharacterized protein (DUF305 family)
MTAEPRAHPAVLAPKGRMRVHRMRTAVGVAGMVALVMLAGTIGFAIGQQRPFGAERSPLSGPAAFGFASDVAMHLEQAVTIAALAREHGGDPAVRELAPRIESTESVQLARIRGWLDLWTDQSRPEGQDMDWLAVAAADDHQLEAMASDPARTHHGGVDPAVGDAQRHGMATHEDLHRLREASGDELDVLFLQLALRQHEGGEMLLDYGALLAEVGAVRELAEEMLVQQAEEGTRMREMLAERNAAPLQE